MRINWNRVPYYMITTKPAFGNIGKVIGSETLPNQSKVYTLASLVNREMVYKFYDFELIKLEGDNALQKR